MTRSLPVPIPDARGQARPADLGGRFAPTGQTKNLFASPQPTSAPDPIAPPAEARRSARVTYEGDGLEATVEAGHTTLLDVSVQHKVPHFRECGGRGRCTTCRVEVLDGLSNLTARTDREVKLAEARGWAPNVRLACQSCPVGDVRLRRLVRTPADVSILQTETLREDPGHEVEVAILSCDLRGFTPFADTHLPFDVVHVLNRVFGHLGDPILLNNGVIYQYVGDQVIGLFGVDGKGTAAQHCLQAVRAGLGMIDALGALNESLAGEFDTEVDVRIGAHFGKLVVGYLGHPSRRTFAAIGDAMNVTCRVEEANKELGTRFLVTSSLLARLPVSIRAGRHATVELKGKRGRHPLVEVQGFAEADAESLVQGTARLLLGAQSRFADVFYRRLFEALPAARAMFGEDLKAQAEMLTQTLQSAVYGLSRYDQIAPGLVSLGRRHVGYGVTREHYAVLLDVFHDAAHDVLGERFTPEVAAAWREVLARIASEMCGEPIGSDAPIGENA
jgi:class 3 adenylate cyclase/truncated hemoglobin YjbI